MRIRRVDKDKTAKEKLEAIERHRADYQRFRDRYDEASRYTEMPYPPACRDFMKFRLNTLPNVELCMDCQGFFWVKSGLPVPRKLVRWMVDYGCPF